MQIFSPEPARVTPVFGRKNVSRKNCHRRGERTTALPGVKVEKSQSKKRITVEKNQSRKTALKKRARTELLRLLAARWFARWNDRTPQRHHSAPSRIGGRRGAPPYLVLNVLHKVLNLVLHFFHPLPHL